MPLRGEGECAYNGMPFVTDALKSRVVARFPTDRAARTVSFVDYTFTLDT
jgi:hypothetical protein